MHKGKKDVGLYLCISLALVRAGATCFGVNSAMVIYNKNN